MRNGKRILSLLLVAMLMLTILPASAHADPPAEDPTHRHKWVSTGSKNPTCTRAGSKSWRCSACGQTYTETVPALGHSWTSRMTQEQTCEQDGIKTYTCVRCGVQVSETRPALGHEWDEGKVTVQPWLLSPGERTFTCKRDPSHTRTEEIEPSADAVFASLSTGSWATTTFDLTNNNPLIITEDPVGGSITRWEDETHTMHVTASGGVGEYTYEWHTASQDVGKDEKYNDLLKWFVGLFGVTPEEVDQALEASYSNTDTCTVSLAGQDYYCIVHDEAGQSATSDKAPVRYKIRVAKQPDNVNLQSETTDFYCEAADGSGDYTYRWYDHDEGILGEGQSYPAGKEGYYYCIVTDNVTGETVNSEYCEVYSTEPFHLENITQDCEVLPKDDTFVIASFAGGVEDYEIWWDKNGTAIDSVEGRDEQDHVYSRTNVDGPGKYTVHGVDSMYATASGSVTITVPKLTIVEQPKGGVIPQGGKTEVSVSIEGGDAPFSYTLYRNGALYNQNEHAGDVETVPVWYPGNYYFHIEDALGRMVDSNVATFENPEFRIVSQTGSASLKALGETAKLEIEVEGGKEPYTYEWMQYRGDTPWYTKASATATCPARQPGRYACLVTDDAGEKLHSKEILVTYTGDTPWITQQPKGGVLEQGGSLTLSCDAVSGSGGELRFDWERTPSGVRPSWSNVSRRGGSYKSIDATVPGTYRCKVTDTKTGKYVYSTAAFVTGELTASVESYVLSPHMGYDADNIMCTFNITGGAAPYTMKVYIVYAAYHSDKGVEPSRTVLWETHAVNTIGEAKDFKCQVPRTYYYPYYDDGQWKNGLGYLKSYAIITDADGRTTRVEIIE